jgi:hypothetical protein
MRPSQAPPRGCSRGGPACSPARRPPGGDRAPGAAGGTAAPAQAAPAAGPGGHLSPAHHTGGPCPLKERVAGLDAPAALGPSRPGTARGSGTRPRRLGFLRRGGNAAVALPDPEWKEDSLIQKRCPWPAGAEGAAHPFPPHQGPRPQGETAGRTARRDLEAIPRPRPPGQERPPLRQLARNLNRPHRPLRLASVRPRRSGASRAPPGAPSAKRKPFPRQIMRPSDSVIARPAGRKGGA